MFLFTQFENNVLIVSKTFKNKTDSTITKHKYS